MGLLLTITANGSVEQFAVVLIWGAAYSAVPVAWSLWLTRVVPDQRETASAIFVAAVQVAIAIGASLGGVVVDVWGAIALYGLGSNLVIGSALALHRATGAARSD
jgi:predicted MFS family arabinose efflux permease